MIGINNFGWRLGNQMFQLATAVTLAKSNNDYVAFPKWDYAQYFAGDFTPVDFHGVYEHKEDGFHYRPIVYRKALGLNGYFQSEKYFIDQQHTIRTMFVPNKDVERTVFEKFNQLETTGGPTCAVHVRRGDYVNLPNHHPTVPREWYWDDIASFEEGTHFLIFSDDTGWCYKNIKAPCKDIERHKITVVEGGTDIEDFFMQQLCDNNIIANSSYSWWAAWLNTRTERVIAPKQWFGPVYDDWDTKDLIPDRWEIL